jgi:hypothetical protein
MKGYTMNDYAVCVGIDVGKSFHHLYALGKCGEVLADRPVRQCEQELTEAFKELLEIGSVLAVVDQPNNIGSLTIACARKAGCSVAYLPGLAMRRAAGILPGDVKTDGYDAFVIAMTSHCMPHSIRTVPPADELRSDLLALAAYDDDCRCDLTREINRLRAHLIECHPAFEHALGDDVTSPFAIKLLEKYGGPWSVRKAGKNSFMRWVGGQKRVPKKLLERLLEAIWKMSDIPAGATLREKVSIPACAKRIGELLAARKEMGRRMEELLACDPTFLALMSVPGVGTKTAVAFIVHVDVSAFSSSDKLASYAGIAPRTRQSGTSIKGESASRIGNRALKSGRNL